ncbi:hypothetical protein L1987_76292 [Smallanthus sonchifolius]|uniref:Uncharacterized protein n=1 Tax=Smallanthus sonchifolius TaxID=185202 RepID=A0ACB9A7S6_9ASTR|nr:hypothetical protein L1987_76292 [Smallanthus sonchifolius]
MADSSSVSVILEFLKSNKFSKAEAALRRDIGNRTDLDGFMQDLKLEQGRSSQISDVASKEDFVVKVMEYGTARNGSDGKVTNVAFVKEKSRAGEPIGTKDNNYRSFNNSDETVLDLYSRNFSSSNGSVDLYQNDASIKSNDVKESQVSSQSKIHPFELADTASRVLKQQRVESVDKVIEPKEFNEINPVTGAVYKDDFVDSPWLKNDEFKYTSSELWKDCSVKTIFPFPKGDASTSYDTDIRAAIKEQVDEAGRALYFATTQRNNESKSVSGLGFPVISEKHKEELPRLPHVKLKSDDKSSSIAWEEKYQRDGFGSKPINVDSTYLIGSFLDVPIGQEISSSGGKRLAGGNWFSVSQGITEDTSDLVSGFATIGDGLSESMDYPNDYWDSDEYEDDDDVGYMRQPIEDETWFLAHEIDYPSDDEKKTEPQEKIPPKNDDDDLSFAEDDSCLSSDQYFHSKNVGRVTRSGVMIGQYDGRLMDETELSLVRAEPGWKGVEGPHLDDICVDEEQHGSVRSIGVGINSDMADFGSERELDGISACDSEKKYVDRNMKVKISKATSSGKLTKNASDGGFSFPPSKDGKLLTGVNKAYNAIASEENDDLNPPWRQNSSISSPVKSSRDEDDVDGLRTADSSPSTLSNFGYAEWACQVDQKVGGSREDEPRVSLEDEEAAAVQEQVNQIKAQEEEYETFNLKILHRKNRTGFEEDKNFNVFLNSVIGGRYQVTEYLGSAAFSKAVQAHDIHTGMDVCVKIIKNNKDFFDQSLDEIKLLKFINKHDPGDKYHLLRLYDYFYYREHLLIVCELLKANLYEFHKFNRESGGEVYFTMPRLQSITIQCLEALEFLHGLGLIHCDLKPENILVKSYSRCEVKVIDLGSSCFETDHLCSYVQSRSYRAPEVILGLPYGKKIDIWSLGCILAELCTGNVLFQNDSPATLLARVIGIISPIGQDMLAKGRDTHKYFSKNHMLYERNQDTNILEYLIPKKTSLRHRLPMGDQGFIDFVSHLLEINPKKRPSATEALKHPWLSYPYEPISS